MRVHQAWRVADGHLLELKAIFLALQALCNHMQNRHIKVLCDNTTAVSYIRNIGGTKSCSCNDITREIFMWCIDRQLTLSISHLPGKLNTEADKASRVFHNSNTEWSLDQTSFNELKSELGEPDVDMFASRLNHKTPHYIAWRRDPGAELDAQELCKNIPVSASIVKIVPN